MQSRKKIELQAEVWDKIIENERKSLNLSELELSALSSWLVDCFESYEHIYSNFLERIKNANPGDHDLIHDCVVDIFWQLDHIKSHIIDAEKGFSELMHLLAKKAEEVRNGT